MKRKLILGCLILITLVTFGCIGLIGWITWDQYQDTKAWEDTRLDGDLSEVPPFLARNYVRAEDKEAIRIWNRVSTILEEIDEAGGIDPGQTDTYRSALEDSVTEQEAYGLTEGTIPLQNQRLELYLEIEEVTEQAYETPQTEALQAVTNRLYALDVNQTAEIHEVYFDTLRTIAGDYANLAVFLDETLPKLGAVDEGVLTVNTDIGPKNTEKIRSAIEEQHLDRFPFIRKLGQLLDSSDWERILERNELSREYGAWQEAKAKLEALSKSDYYNVSIITTYQQALDAGLETKAEERDGYTIDPNSPVESITYQGDVLQPDQYIRYGTPVLVRIKEEYRKIPEEPVEEEPQEQPSDSSETGNGTPDDGWSENWDDSETDDQQPDSGETPGTETTPDTGETPDTGTSATPETDPGDGWTDEW